MKYARSNGTRTISVLTQTTMPGPFQDISETSHRESEQPFLGETEPLIQARQTVIR